MKKLVQKNIFKNTIDEPKPPEAKAKSWLGEKDTHYVTAGVSECLPNQITYEIAGVAKVTPSNSDESFFSALRLDKSRRVFPRGRENLSRRWQEWLLNVDDNYSEMEEKADELIKSVQAIMKLAFPEPVCDGCCPCRQTRRTREKWRQTKTPYLLIDNVLLNGEKKCATHFMINNNLAGDLKNIIVPEYYIFLQLFLVFNCHQVNY